MTLVRKLLSSFYKQNSIPFYVNSNQLLSEHRQVNSLRKIVGAVLVVVVIGLAISTLYMSLSQLSQNLTGTVRVKRSPVITTIELFDDDNGGTTTPTSELTPMDEMTIRVTLNFQDAGYIYSVKVIIYYNLVGINAPDNASHHVTLYWSSITGTWTLSAGGSTTWALDTANSRVPQYQISGTDYILVVFTPGKITRFSNTGNWIIYANVTDRDNPSVLYGEGSLTGLNCRYYLEMGVDATSFDFGSVPPGAANISLYSPRSINVTVISNYWWYLRFNATGWYDATTGQLVVDFAQFNSLLADDDPYPRETRETGLVPIWIRPIGSLWDYLSPTPEAGTIIRLHLFVTLPSDIPYGTYRTTLTITTGRSHPPP